MERKKVIGIIVMILLVLGIIYYFCNYGITLVDAEDIKTVPEYEDIVYDDEEDILKQDVLGILTIEKIGLKATVKEGSNKEILEEYIGHIENTSTYDGNIGLAAHNRGYEINYFENLKSIQKGDEITYKYNDFEMTYIVDTIEIIEETDWSYLVSQEKNKITLITCVENEPKFRRCVQASAKQ